MNCSDSKADKLVVVVHGVGDPKPGDTLSLFARSLAETDRPLLEYQEVIWLAEKSQDTDHVRTFPVHRRRLQYRNQSIELCEAFWGDLSRVRRGWVGVFQGIFQIVFGLRYVAYIAADQPGPGAHWLKRLGLISSRILHGPVLAVTFYLALLMMAVCGTQMLWPASYQAAIWTQIVLAGCSMVAIAAAGIGCKITRSRVVERFWFWVNVTTVFVTGLMFLKSFLMDYYYPGLVHECPIHPGLLWYCRVLLVLLGLLWFIEIQVLFAMGVSWFFSMAHPRASRPALHAAFLIPALAVGIWGQGLPLLWLSAKEGISILAKLEKFADVFDDAIPFLGVQLMMLVVIVSATMVVLFRYFRWRSTATTEQFKAGKRPPRLIVSGWLQAVLAVCTAVGVVLVGALCIAQFFGPSYIENFWLRKLMAQANGYAVSVLVPMGGLLFLLIPRLRPAFDMLLDVVNHFYFRPTNVEAGLEDDDEFDIAETTFENGALFFSRRDALHLRVKKILSHYRDECEHQQDLIIVGHSQGTMMAIEVLNDEDIAWMNNCFKSVTLVTMGSPLNNLYQHYFAHCYPPLDQPYWSSLRRRLDRWVNIFRIDDFVGTELQFPNSANPDSRGSDQDSRAENLFYSPTVYSNHAVGPRGHKDYWSDRDVLEILREHLFQHGSADIRKKAA